MKNILILTTLFITSLFFFYFNWEHNYYKALHDAKVQHKDVYLFIGADDCRFCELFYKETLSKKYVMDRLKEKFIPLYMSRDQQKIPNRFEKYGVPRHYFLTPEGKIIHADRGSREPDGFFDILDEVDLKKGD